MLALLILVLLHSIITDQVHCGCFQSKLCREEESIGFEGVNASEFYSRYKLLNQIGKGAFGVIFKAKDRQTGGYVAVKKSASALKALDLASESNMIARVMRNGGSGGIVEMINSYWLSDSEYAIVFELMTCDGLHEYQRNTRLFKSKRKLLKRVLRDILPAMLHLKQQGIVHADIKLENILYQKSSKRFKLSDFGAALNYGRHFNRLRGTYSILSPEIYGEFLYSSSSDMWALATEMLSAVAGSWAFKATKKDFWDIPQQWQHWLGPMPEDIQRTLAARKFNVSQTNTLPAIDRLFSKPSDPLKDFIKRALAYDYRHRLTVEEALNHEFLLE